MTTLTRPEIEKVVREVVLAHLSKQDGAAPPKLTVHASARHMHASREDLERLFGRGHELTPDRPLFQPGNFAAKETVALAGPRGRVISNLRILGPLRNRTQVELAFTDAIALGFENVPVRLSGDIDKTPGAYLIGPKGMVELKEGVIRAAIHVHMNPREAAHFGVEQGGLMRLRVGGDAAITFDRVHVRVDPSSILAVHMDTDEANACGLHMAKEIELIK